jgi:hypothetical protein
VALIVSAGLIAAWLVAWVHETRLRRDSAQGIIDAWQFSGQGLSALTADVAAEQWHVLRQQIGSAYDLLAPGPRAQPYCALSDKYFAEGRWALAFAMWQTVVDIIGHAAPPHPRMLYLAALAGRTDWLNGLRRSEEDGGRNALIQACTAWAEGRYEDIPEIAASASPRAEATGGARHDSPAPLWLAFLHVRALAAMGRPGDAAAVLDSDIGADVVRMSDDRDMMVHVAAVIAAIVEDAGDARGALALSESMLAPGGPLSVDVSWAVELERTRERVARLRGRLESESPVLSAVVAAGSRSARQAGRRTRAASRYCTTSTQDPR